MVEALKRDYDVSVLTWSPPDLDGLNRFYGTSLGRSDFTVHSIPAPVRRLFEFDPDPRSIQKVCLLMRIAKIIRHRYDLLISTREMDFGRRGIQYVSYPWLQPHYSTWQSLERLPWHARASAVIRGRYRPWMLLAGYSFERMTENLTLAVSEWTRTRFRESYGVDALTVYPPVVGGFPEVPWEQRAEDFVCLGRIAAEKRVERILEILAAVRAHEPATRLHIIGNPSGPRDYYHAVRGSVAEHASWVRLHENLSRAEMMHLVSRNRYGIHARPDEQFGIAVAEMVEAGCIVFAPNDGGPVEILGGDDRLLYRAVEDAVAKILRVMKDPGEQAALRRHLESRRHLFSTAEFVRRIQDVVRQFLANA
jgi:glycosyltransferase involved in cell wall biosynthesis